MIVTEVLNHGGNDPMTCGVRGVLPFRVEASA